MNFSDIKLRNKIIALASFIILVFSALIAFYIIPTVNNIIETRTITKLEELTDLPYKEIERQYSFVESGKKTKEAALNDALNVIQNFRYSETDYFWVNDYDGMMLMHPTSNQLVDTVVLDIQDPDGKYFFQEMVSKVKSDGNGVVHYQWPKPGKEVPQPKISFVRGFEPWQLIVGTGVYVDDLKEIQKNIYTRVITISIIIILFSIALIALIVLPLNKTLKLIITRTDQYKDLDFTEEIGLRSNDELGQISQSFDSVSSSLKELLAKMIQSSEDLYKDSAQIAESVEMLESGTDSTLESTTNISAIIEETSASTHVVSSTIEEIRSAIEVVAEKATEGAEKANDVSQRAVILKTDAVNATENAQNIYSNVKIRLTDAIENAKEVSKISSLLEDILRITSQTNLLALNASIEAARAGDAGRGFAVVANEVGKLAEESANMVENIQKTVNYVQSSVNTLISDSGEILKFIEENVLTDYKKLDSISDQYNSDATIFNNIMMELSAISEEVFSSVESISHSMNEVRDATVDESSGVENILEMTKDITEKTQNVNKIVQTNIMLIKELDELINKFKI